MMCCASELLPKACWCFGEPRGFAAFGTAWDGTDWTGRREVFGGNHIYQL